MEAVVESTIQWTEKIKSDSAVRDPLGLWTDHLEIQVEFTPGITSVTDRIRYYTNLAWYWKNLSDTISPAELEKIFILKCLSHHNGNSKNPHLGNVFNKTRFDGEWQQKSSFDLKFKINGFGKSYYNSQLEILRCAWTDFAGNAVLSPINDKLASSLSQLVPGDFERQTFSKDFLKNHFDGLCICDSTSNKKEIDIMSKLFFGFFSLQNGDWDIDDSEFERF